MPNPLCSNTPALLAWFAQNGKHYPWGRRPTPYRVWVSEIMLQQTVITTVVPYFRRWMQRFPSLCRLAAATEEEVLQLWEGLGYYSRARHLREAAGVVAAKHGGRLPRDFDDLRRLPGIGPYTAAAILSIGCGLPYPVLDANVMRIMQRLLGLATAGSAEKQRIGNLLQEAIPGDQPGMFNEALMQLGQLVCRRQSPLCGICPLAKPCLALRQGVQESIPVKRRRETEQRTSLLAVCCCRDEYYVVRKQTGRFRGLWLFPESRQLGGWLRQSAGSLLLKEEDHFYTRYKDHLKPVLYCFGQQPGFTLPGGAWKSLSELKNLPVPSVYRKIIIQLGLLPEQ